MSNRPSGILLLDKQPGMTSFDCIRALKKLWGRSDLGHGGTLDRFASGLLPVLAGDALKLVRFFLESYPALPTYWKSYSGTFEFGVATETGDPEGEVIETVPPSDLDLARVSQAMAGFIGMKYEQVPPKFSAKKIGGERASDLARAGKPIELKPVSVAVRDFRCTGIEGNLVHFEARCSKGTYIRVLAMDLARRLDSVAYVKSLRRTAVGEFQAGEALTLEVVEKRGETTALLDMQSSTSFLPRFPLIAAERAQLLSGKTDFISARLANSGFSPGVYCATADGAPAGIFELLADKRAKFLRGLKT